MRHCKNERCWPDYEKVGEHKNAKGQLVNTCVLKDSQHARKRRKTQHTATGGRRVHGRRMAGG